MKHKNNCVALLGNDYLVKVWFVSCVSIGMGGGVNQTSE